MLIQIFGLGQNTVAKLFQGLAVLAVTLSAPVVATAQSSDGFIQIESVPCPIKLPYGGEEEGVTYDCNVVIVPENHETPGERTVELAVMRLKSTSLSSMPDPLVYLSGGPGGSALHEIASLQMLHQNLQATRARRDVIFYDQRGTGHSQILTCGPFNAAAGVVGELFPQVEISDLESAMEKAGTTLSLILCATGLKSVGVELAEYNSVASAHDIAAIVSALGYEEDYNLYGTSYGTRLALNAMRSTPDRIRSVVLDGTATPDTPNNAYTATRIQEQYDNLFRHCEADEFCGGSFPGLKDRFVAVLEKLSADPLVFDPPMVPKSFLRNRYPIIEQIDPGFFAGFGKISNDSAQGGFAAFLPWIITALETDDTELLRKILGGEPPEEVAPVATVASAEDALEADDLFLAPSIDLIIGYATRAGETDAPTISTQWISLVVERFKERLQSGEEQATVIKDFIDFALLPLNGTDRAALEEFAETHLGAAPTMKSHALITSMTRQDVRDTMWAIQDMAEVMSGAGERTGVGIAFGILFAINCQEDIALTPHQVALDFIAESRYPGVIMQSAEDYGRARLACEYFPQSFTKEEMMSPVVSDIPALIFQEALDSQTSLSLGYKALETLENGFLLEWPSEGHVIVGRSPDGCAGAIAAAFLDRPSREPDYSCSKAPYYTIRWDAAADYVNAPDN